MKKACLLFLCLLMIPAFLSSQNVETKDGARLVHNARGGLWGPAAKVELKLIRKIGDVDAADENLAFNGPGDLVEDQEGSIYIADAGNFRIQRFDNDGNFKMSIGRKGQGPGEFGSVRSLSIDPTERLHALDGSQRRILVFSKMGRLLDTTRLLRGTMDRLLCLNDDRYLVHEQVPGPKPDESKMLLKILDKKETVVDEFCAAQNFGESVTNQIGNSLQAAIGRDGAILVSFIYQNRIEQYSPDVKLRWRADRPLNFETKIIEKGKFEKTSSSTRYTSPKMNSCSRGIAADGAGRIWVVTYRRQIKPEEVIRVSQYGTREGVTIKREGNTDLRTTDMYQLEVFDREGILLGAIPLTHFVDGIWIYGDRLYLLDRERGVTYYQYEIVER